MNHRHVTLVITLLGSSLWAQQKTMPAPTTTRPLETRVARYEDPQREAWQKPNEVVAAFKLKKTDVVADIGAGTGYFSRRFARVVPKGKVYAVDIAADILEWLRNKAAEEKITNIETILSKEDDPMLPPNSVNLVFICDAAHHITNRPALYKKLAAATKKGGRMAILDFPPDLPDRPHPPEELIPREQSIKEADEAGFQFVEELKIPGRQYFLLFKKKS